MSETEGSISSRILQELKPGLSPQVLAQIPAVSTLLKQANHIICHGVGREGLMMRALTMRLFHLGCKAHVVGDMTTPPAGKGDVLFISAGPGRFATVEALVDIAQANGAQVICITAQPTGSVPQKADHVIEIPAQTMASDQNEQAASILPMGSLFEALMFLFFEVLVLDLRDAMGVSAEAMRGNHTNLE